MNINDALCHNIHFFNNPHSGKPQYTFGTVAELVSPEPDSPFCKLAHKEYGALAYDNGGTALAYTCTQNKIPFAAIEIIGGHIKNQPLCRSIKEVFEIRGLAMIESFIPIIGQEV
jgi:nucleoside phosphorylase